MLAKVAVIGAGHVGSTLGKRLLENGYRVQYGSRNPSKSLALERTLQVQSKATGGAVEDAVYWGDIVILATPCMHEDPKLHALALTLGPHITGKVLIDVTNPFSNDLGVRWKEGTSAAEVLQHTLPGTFVFKAFNCLGVEHIAHPDGELITGDQLTMMFAGPSEKSEVCRQLVQDVGFIPEYVGPIRYARNLEALAELYVHLGSGFGGVKWGRNFNFQVLRERGGRP